MSYLKTLGPRRTWTVPAAVALLIAAALLVACRGGPEAPSSVLRRPNVLLVVVDTLRRDHLGCYGYPRATSPNLDREIAARGVVLDAAYSPAPWTLPSVASLVTSNYPGEIFTGDVGHFALPAEVVTLPERMRQLGYVTAGFFANALIQGELGFDRGFDTFFSVPRERFPGPQAEELAQRARQWLEGRGGQRFFLQLHFMDPHDPYESPELVDGRSPFFPGYDGHLTGDSLQPLFIGRVQLENPDEDVAHLTALYDSEVHYVDRYLGEVLAAMGPELLADTLIVFTGDHGEELYDHGGWRHARTLYDEVVRVPLLLRWDGHIPAGSRLDGTVRLLDLAPTIVAAAGGEPAPDWKGVNLLPALLGERPLPRLKAFAQHMFRGPLRVMMVEDGRKLFFYNRAEPWGELRPGEEFVFDMDRRTLPRQAFFDLARDPREKTNLLAAGDGDRPAELDALEREIHLQLNRQMQGLRVIASGLAAGSHLEGRLKLKPPPKTWEVYFLRDDDRVEIVGSELRFELYGEGFDKGLVIPGEPGTIRTVEARLDGRPLATDAIRLGDAAFRGKPAAAAGLRLASEWPVRGQGPRLYLWYGAGPQVSPAFPADAEENLRRLKALGYLPP